MRRWLRVATAVFVLASWLGLAHADLVIRAGDAPIRTEGGPLPDGAWNLWSNGRVGQPIRIDTDTTLRIVVRGWGSPAGGIWPEMALLVDGRIVETVSVETAQRSDYVFRVPLTAGVHELAVAFLNDGLVGQEDRNLYLERVTLQSPDGAADPALADRTLLAQQEAQREREVVAATDPSIEKHRQGDGTIRVVDARGVPVRGAKLSIKQLRHEFLFGCNIYMFDRYRDASLNEQYKQRFADLFNYATVGFYWRSYEWERGKPNYEYTDKVVDWCREHDIQLKGHPLLWGDKAGIPVWSDGQPSPELQRQRVTDIMQRYRDRIKFWEVVNEPSHLAEPVIDDPYRWARQVNADAYLIVNDYHVLGDGAPGFHKLLADAKRREVPFDGIGIQAHEPRTMRFPLDRVRAILDDYAMLGKELHITEFTPTSSGQKFTGSYREGVWNEASQADYAESFYRVCFAHPAMRAITWWDLCDQGSWLEGGGMLRADMSTKSVYERLRKLIHEEWSTEVTADSDVKGQVSFRGFYGDYHVIVEADDQRVERSWSLSRRGPQELTVTLE